MEVHVDQEDAIRRARRMHGWLALWPVAVVVTVPIRRSWTPEGVLLIVVVLAALGLTLGWAFARQQEAWLRRTWGYTEARLTARDPDRLATLVQRHMRIWWFVHVEDVRRWRSIYSTAYAKAPLRLPLEFDVEGDEIVLRGSAVHVQAAQKRIRRWLRSAQGGALPAASA